MPQWMQVTAIYVWFVAGCAGGLPAAEKPARGDQQSVWPATVPGSGLQVSFGPGLGTRAPLLAGGMTLPILVGGAPGTVVPWWLAYEGTVVDHGHIEIDKSGAGQLRLALPEVRSRTGLDLAVAMATNSMRQPLIIYPASPLRAAAERLRQYRIGVIDPTGRVQRALGADGVACRDLAPQIARDYFDGELVVLAGYYDAGALGEICRQFDSRVRGGTRLLVLNPPAGWAAWEHRRKELDAPERGKVGLAGGFCPSVPVEDFGEGPWHALLDCPPGTTALVGVVRRTPRLSAPPAPDTVMPPAPDAEVPQSRGAATPRVLGLLTVSPVDRGCVMASVLPQTEFPDRDVVGRNLLAEMVLWSLDQARFLPIQPREN